MRGKKMNSKGVKEDARMFRAVLMAEDGTKMSLEGESLPWGIDESRVGDSLEIKDPKSTKQARLAQD